jgi:hypothetical protein
LQGLYLYTEQHKLIINAYTQQTSMPQVGFEPTIPVSERVKTVNDLDHVVTVIGSECFTCVYYVSTDYSAKYE